MRQRSARSSIIAVPAHITLSAAPQYSFKVPSSSGTAPSELAFVTAQAEDVLLIFRNESVIF